MRFIRRTLTVSLAVFALSLATAACDDEETTTTNPTPSPAPSGSSTTTPTAQADIVATAEGAGQFKTLVAAVKAADLEATLKGTGPFTVFAPTDAAFEALPAGTLDELLKPENKSKLASILTYHVVSGNVPSTEAVKLTSAKTVNGKDLTLSTANGGLEVDGAKVVQADVKASNGVIHVIDKVLIPAE